MTSTGFYAKRRPDWDLPELHADLKVSSHKALLEKPSRSLCPKCQKSRALYCYDCLLPLTSTPKLTALPFHFYVILDGESRSKNTGVQAAILSPDHVTICNADTIPDVEPGAAVTLFPSQEALNADSVDYGKIKHVFVIDSKWKKAAKLAETHEKLKGYRHVKLTTTKSSYWRFHTRGVPDRGVCTIEAIWAFLNVIRDGGSLGKSAGAKGEEENGEDAYPEHCFDDLLWYFSYQHALIGKAAEEKQVKRAKHAREGC